MIAYDSHTDCNSADSCNRFQINSFLIFIFHFEFLLPCQWSSWLFLRINLFIILLILITFVSRDPMELQCTQTKPTKVEFTIVIGTMLCGSIEVKENYNCQNSLNLFYNYYLTIWLQPPFFSILTWHFGHSFVLAATQFAVSESSLHFLIHFFK